MTDTAIRSDWIDSTTITTPEQVVPGVIDRVAFTERRFIHGYDPHEVDAFLDVVNARVEHLMRELARLKPLEQVEDPEDGGPLTAAEHRFVTLLGQAWDLLASEIVDSGHQQMADLSELIGPMHALQNAVLAQAAARAYPDRYRALGTSLAGR